ncbi:HAMP domain-containing protein [Tychonema sp. LEGE 07199]|uniref:ATP-binding protein n=1 Tax=unclassified Tychonema TaxID=2642144 RepID=UPI0018829094|nr:MULTISPECIES: ATP-binding protein [unclassified Tychonema]MBE9121603.1 HAMP domain-containing protein [Tychonema sp. LEGE 07199]MBE9130367.1 HAMP domain-containing protein [Tychonema sp. LEGE 07196]
MASQSPAFFFPKLFKEVPLQAILVVPFVVQTVGAVGIIGYLSFKNGQKAVNDVAAQLRHETSDRIEQNLTQLVATPFQAFESYEAALSQNRINLNNGRDIEKFLWRQLPAFGNLSLTAFVTTNQEFFGAERQDGAIAIRTSEVENNRALTTYRTNSNGDRLEVINAGKPNFDPRQRSYYMIPTQRKQATWGKVFPHITGKTMYIAPGQPIYNSARELQGVWIASLNLSMIGDFLRSLKIGTTGQSFILERSGELIATSTGEKPFRYYPDKVVQLPEQRVERLNAIDSQNFITQKTSQFLLERFQDFHHIQTFQQLEFSINNRRQFVQVSPFQDGRGIDWVVVVTVPEADFMDRINATTQSTIVLSLLALFISLGIGILASRWITQPILRLNQASSAMAAGSLSQAVKESSVYELQELTQSFNRMAQQLQESFNSLEQANEQLEYRVEERTAELKAAKDEVETALRELQLAQTQLIQSEKMSSLGQLVAGVAHEINNPVNFIYGNLDHADEYTQELLKLLQAYQTHYPEPIAAIAEQSEAMDLDFIVNDLSKVIESMKEGARRIREIVLALRTFSRLDEAELKSINIHDGIDSTLVILGNRLKPKLNHPRMAILRNYGSLPLVECYPGPLNQVFMNILSNAIDAIESAIARGKQITPAISIYTALIDNRWAEIRIGDNGNGIPEAIQQQIFDPFFTTKPIGSGTGMGLAISYQIVADRHQGSLSCNSQSGEGTEFVIKIPLKQNLRH